MRDQIERAENFRQTDSAPTDAVATFASIADSF
jgi:hypothetical protein